MLETYKINYAIVVDKAIKFPVDFISRRGEAMWNFPFRMGAKVGRQLYQWRERAGQRRQLKQLDSGRLNDIGLSRSQVVDEVSKPFWAE